MYSTGQCDETGELEDGKKKKKMMMIMMLRGLSTYLLPVPYLLPCFLLSLSCLVSPSERGIIY